MRGYKLKRQEQASMTSWVAHGETRGRICGGSVETLLGETCSTQLTILSLMQSKDEGPKIGLSTTPTSSLLTARALILLQLLSRLLTFGLNQALVRLAPPEVFGTAAIQFDLVCSTIIFLSREGIRNALLRSPAISPKVEDNSRRIQDKRLVTLPLWLGIVVSLLTVMLYLSQLPQSTSRQSDFHSSLALYVLSSLIELGIEPHYVAALRSSPPRMRVRVQAEGGMAITKAVVTVGCVVLFEQLGHGRPLLAFAIGQTMGAVWLAGRYILEFGLEGLGWVPRVTRWVGLASASCRC
jgi:oligosaccharide translocation protein RFT1